MNGEAIAVENLRFKYPSQEEYALRGIDLKVKHGEFVLIAGPTGCGKSTFCMCLNGLIPHVIGGEMRGTVSVDGRDTRKHEIHELAQDIGMVLQNPDNQLCALTVEDEAAFGPENLALPQDLIRRRVDFALQATRMQSLRVKYVFNLSCGQKQRAAIAASLAMLPNIMTLDEPTSQLDPAGTKEVLTVIRDLNESRGITVILIEHKLEDILKLVDRAILMERGEIVADGEPRELFSRGDLVERLGLRVPQTVRFSYRLRRGGFKEAKICLRLDEVHATLPRDLSDLGGLQRVTSSRDRQAEVPYAKHSEPLVKVKDVWYAYDDRRSVLRGITLNVYPGEFIALIGGNGAGKSTLAMNIAGLFKPTRGRVLVDGLDTREVGSPDMASKVGYVFQNPDCQLFSDSIYDEVAFGPRQLGLARDEVEANVLEALEVVRLKESMSRQPHMLSRGQRLRVAVASVLSMRPKVLLLDEPIMGQDYLEFKSLMTHLKSLNEQGVAVIVITHDINAILRYARRLVVMEGGEIVADGPTREVLGMEEVFCSGGPLKRPTIASLSNMLGVPLALSVDELFKGILGDTNVP